LRETHATEENYRISPRIGKRVIPCAKGKHKEINVLIPKTRQLCSTEYATHVNIPVRVDGQRTMAMIDSGASGNFISEALVRSVGLPTRRKKLPYDLQMADGLKLSTGSIDEETASLPFAIQRHHEEMSFDVVGMATHHIILGMPWLEKHNPAINWKRKVLKFERTGDVTRFQPTRRRRTTVDEKSDQETVEACVTSISNKDGLKKQGSGLTDTSNGPLGQQVRVLGVTDSTPDIPQEY